MLTTLPPYHKFMPRNQVKLLELWDELNIPHKEKKQVFRLSLTVIGIKVDANALSMTMPANTLNELVTAVHEFINTNHQFTLCERQRLAGWINWSLSIFPLLWPSLNNFYAKINGKCAPNKYIRINNAVHANLLWAIQHLESSPSVCLIHHLQWEISSTDIIIYCDMCLDGIGFWLPDKCIGYYSPVPKTQRMSRSSTLKLSASYQRYIMQLISYACPPSLHVLIYTDNDNTVAIFNTLRCLPQYNPILSDAATVSMASDIHLRVLHIPGDLNYVANVISHKKFSLAQQYVPGITILVSSFQPHQLPLGAPKRWFHPPCVPGNL